MVYGWKTIFENNLFEYLNIFQIFLIKNKSKISNFVVTRLFISATFSFFLRHSLLGKLWVISSDMNVWHVNKIGRIFASFASSAGEIVESVTPNIFGNKKKLCSESTWNYNSWHASYKSQDIVKIRGNRKKRFERVIKS